MMATIHGKRRKIPDRIGHGYTPLRVHPLSMLYTKFKNRKRLGVFATKGCKCCVPDCPHEGILLIEGLDHCGNSHVDLYTKDFMLMTVDHHIPLSKGGTEDMSNKFPMCNRHNTKKSNSLPENWYKQFQTK
jgi:hypothetical protein